MFDFLDHFCYLDGVKPDVKWVYHNAVVCVYMPGCFLFEEILELFPEYKVILSAREEDSWIESLARQLEFIHATHLRSNIVSVLSTTARKKDYVLDSFLTAAGGSNNPNRIRDHCGKKSDIVSTTTQCVKSADKLLVYNENKDESRCVISMIALISTHGNIKS